MNFVEELLKNHWRDVYEPSAEDYYKKADGNIVFAIGGRSTESPTLVQTDKGIWRLYNGDLEDLHFVAECDIVLIPPETYHMWREGKTKNDKSLLRKALYIAIDTIKNHGVDDNILKGFMATEQGAWNGLLFGEALGALVASISATWGDDE